MRKAKIFWDIKKNVEYLKEFKVSFNDVLRDNPVRLADLKNFLYEVVEDIIELGRDLIPALQLKKAES